ncbi:iron ABC transporter permease [Oscillospiraceae bacterium MB08-C2-2]|nr:iron ABC transporter permease [Oscillospiraceae bacterium MB08-C2-2]
MKQISSFLTGHMRLACILLSVLLLLSIVLCVAIGPVFIRFSDVWRVLLSHLIPSVDVGGIPDNTQNIIWHLRTPRVLLGVMVGMALSLSGVGMQAFTKNPLADPYVLGISSGASFGAVMAMAYGMFSFLGAYRVHICAFIGAIGAITLVYTLSKNGREITPIKLILIGVAVSAMFGAFTNFTVYNAPDDAKVREATFWMLGGVAGVKWEVLLPMIIVLIPGILGMYCLSTPLNAIMMGDDTAITLGINVNVVRKVLIVLTALLTGVCVSVSGCIGFVGLVIPHIVRSVVGSDHRRVIPLAALMGGIFLVWVDVAARMLDIPKEIPVGILTSMLGAPFFLWMIKARHYAFGEKS